MRLFVLALACGRDGYNVGVEGCERHVAGE